MTARHIISGTAVVGEVALGLFEYRVDDVPPDDSVVRPWAVGALCWIKFTIGELDTSKRVNAKITWPWDQEDRPTDDEIDNAIEAVLQQLRVAVARHGFDPGPLAAELKELT